MDQLLNRLLLFLNTSQKKDVNYEITKYLIQNFSQCETVTIQEICNKCYVSQTSVIRFCKLFNFTSWKSFHEYLVNTKEMQENKLHSRFENIDLDQIYYKLAYIAQGHNKSFKNSLKYAIDMLIQSIRDCNNIYIFGTVYPLSLSLDFQKGMVSQGKIVYCDVSSQINLIDSLDKKDIAIILTSTGEYFPEHKKTVSKIYKSGAKKVVISSSTRYKEMKGIKHYIYIPFSDCGEEKDYDYYLIGVLDIIFVEYYLRYIYKKESVKMI